MSCSPGRGPGPDGADSTRRDARRCAVSEGDVPLLWCFALVKFSIIFGAWNAIQIGICGSICFVVCFIRQERPQTLPSKIIFCLDRIVSKIYEMK